MLLYLMRHGQAAHKLDDPAVGLTPQGRDDIERLAYSLAARGVHFNHVMHSPKTRAEQTALIMRATISPDSSVHLAENIKPNDDPHIMLAELEDWQDDTLVVSHLPFVPSLVSLLIDSNQAITAIDFEPGTVVCLRKEHGNQWQMQWVSSPSLL